VAGSDSNPGTEARPFRTLQHAADLTQQGDTVYVREGNYHEAVQITNSGTLCSPITFAAYPNERPVIDGEYSVPSGKEWGCDPVTGACFTYNALVSLEGSYVIFDGFDVTRSTGRGVRLSRNDHITVRNCQVHDNRNSGILAYRSQYHVIEYNRIWHSGDFAPYPRIGREMGWPGALSLRAGHHSVVRGNEVFNNWGEGIMPMQTDHIVIEDNIVYDNFAVNIYLATVGHVTIQRNLVYGTNTGPFLRGGNPSSGIVFATEETGLDGYATDQIVVNNVCVGNRQNIAWWGEGRAGALINAVIANNTLVNATANDDRAANLAIAPTEAHRNVRIENNIIVQNTDGTIARVPDDATFSLSNNLWSTLPPPDATGEGDIVGDPGLVNADAVLRPGSVSADWYRILANSPARDTGLKLVEVSEDFFALPRDARPDIGAHEYAP
jgi:parallel beta-helix repeat protein